MQLKLTGFALTNDFHDTIGIAMDPLFSPLKHDCDPNAFIQSETMEGWYFEAARLRPLRSIAADQELTVSYVDPTLPCGLRRHLLNEEYFIDCHCQKCLDELGEEQFDPPLNLAEMKRLYEEAMALVESASADLTTSGPIQKLRYAAHILLEASWRITQGPLPLIIHRLVRAYLDDLQLNIALAYASILQWDINEEIYNQGLGKADHPMALLYAYQFINLCQHIMIAEHWAAQRLDLVPRKLEIEFQARSLARTTIGLTGRVPSNTVTQRLGSVNSGLRGGRPNDDAAILNNEENQAKAFEGFEQLIDDVLENLQAGRGEIAY